MAAKAVPSFAPGSTDEAEAANAEATKKWLASQPKSDKK